ncbi:MAG: TIGR00730 family Rossman fold protein [Bacteroidales bacterium]|nr:TIGR00730 family Rossman fold protein [Bacteroidales bacterium]
MKVCFFCASSEALEPKFYSIAKTFGESIVEKNWELVTGGSNVGLMKTLAQTVKSSGGRSIGIIPKMFDDKNLTCLDNTEIIFTKDMQERKKMLFDVSDAFVILPGGFGTLDEMLEIITLKQLGQYKKAIVIYNQDGFYDNMLKQFNVIFESNFAKPQNKNVYVVTQNVEETLNYIENYQEVEIDSYWFDVTKDAFEE